MLVSDIQYGYSTTLNIYKEDTSDGIVRVNPSTVLDTIGMGQLSGMSGSSMMSSSMMGGGSWDVWSELIGNRTLLESQYDVIAGRWPDAYNEIVLIVDENNEISDYALYALGLKDQNEVADTMTRLAKGEEVVSYKTEYTYEDILDLRYRLIVNTDFYSYNEENDSYTDVRDDEDSYRAAIADGIQLQVVGILRPDPDAVTGAVSGSVGYTSALMEYVINQINASDIVKKQAAAPETDVITGLPFRMARRSRWRTPSTSRHLHPSSRHILLRCHRRSLIRSWHPTCSRQPHLQPMMAIWRHLAWLTLKSQAPL